MRLSLILNIAASALFLAAFIVTAYEENKQ